MEFQPVILAAGRGSRMTDMTNKTPKALLPVANMPMVWYPVNMLEKAGFSEAIIVVLQSTVLEIQKALINCNVQMKLDFVTIPDSEDWGTADSLRHIKDKIKTDILLVSCDLVTTLPLHMLADVHRTYDATVTMLLAPSLDTSDMSSPGGKAGKKVERDLVGFDEKGNRILFLSSEADFDDNITIKKSLLKRHPYLRMRSKLMDGHLYIIKKWVVDYLAQETSILTVKGELLPLLVKKQFGRSKESEKKSNATHLSDMAEESKGALDIYSLAEGDDLMKLAMDMSTYNDHKGDMDDCFHGDKIRCYAYVMDGGFCIRANTMVTYCEANRQLPRQLMSLAPEKDLHLVNPSATLAQKSQVGPDSMVGDGTTIAEKVGIKKSVIGKHCSISEKVKITNCVIMDHVTIQEGCTLSGCVVCENAHINEKSELKDCLVGKGQTILAMGKFTNEVIVDLDSMMKI